MRHYFYFSLPALLSLVTCHLASCKTYPSFDDWLDDLPSCARSCITPLYDDVLKSCGATRSSSSKSDLLCLCKGGDISASEQFERGQKEGECAARACDLNDDTEIVQSSLDFVEFCLELVDQTSGSTAAGGK
jgi:hypothetical protein